MDIQLIQLLLENLPSVIGFIASIIGMLFSIVLFFLRREDKRRKEEIEQVDKMRKEDIEVRTNVYNKITDTLTSIHSSNNQQLSLMQSMTNQLQKMNVNQEVIKQTIKT